MCPELILGVWIWTCVSSDDNDLASSVSIPPPGVFHSLKQHLGISHYGLDLRCLPKVCVCDKDLVPKEVLLVMVDPLRNRV